MAAVRLYESDDVLVKADLAGAGGVVVCFSNFELIEKAEDFGNGFVQSLGLSAVFVTGKVNHWWQVPDRTAMCAAIREATAQFARRTAYGSSMGGYGALALGAEAGCNRILALAPQTVIGDPKVPLRQEWADAIAARPMLRDRVADDLAGIVPEIVYDPQKQIDRRHVVHLRARAEIRELCLPFAGHTLMVTLQECRLLRRTMTALLRDEGDFATLHKAYLTARHRSPAFLFNVAQAELEAGDADAARTTASLLLALGVADKHRAVMQRAARLEADGPGRTAPAGSSGPDRAEAKAHARKARSAAT